MIQKHCFECGTALIEKELEEEGIVPYCPKCQQYRFPMYNVAVSMIVVDEETGKILLIQQYGKPSYILVADGAGVDGCDDADRVGKHGCARLYADHFPGAVGRSAGRQAERTLLRL